MVPLVLVFALVAVVAVEVAHSVRQIGRIDSQMVIADKDAITQVIYNLLDNAIEAASVPELSEIGDSLRTIELQFRKTDNFFMISVTNPCAVAPEINDGKIQTSKKDRKNHGFGIHNIENAASGYGGELTVDCEEKPYGFLFRAEVVFPTSSIE